MPSESSIPVETILQNLIQFETVNPPGNEVQCINYIRELLQQTGLESNLYAKSDTRPNLVCRVPGKGQAPPILIYGHVDVVTTEGQKWKYPPFEGKIEDGFIWGRGALDMKGGVAMMLSALLRMKQEGITPAGDVIFLALSDEEDGGEFGADFMVSEHPEVFDGVKFALGEFGGFNLTIGGKRFYPIQVAEKQHCHITITTEGLGGHGAMIVTDCAMEKMGRIISRLSGQMLPFHVVDPVRLMVEGMSEELSFPLNMGIKMLLNPNLSKVLLKQLGEVGNAFVPMFHNTVNATIVRGGSKINVIPSRIELTLDGRILPGFDSGTFLNEIRSLIQEEDMSMEVTRFDPGPPTIDMGLFSHLAGVLKSLDPDGVPVPYLLTAVTDARFLAKLNIQSYGFLPMKLPPDFEFFKLAHAADERIPLDALKFGADGIYQALKTYSG